MSGLLHLLYHSPVVGLLGCVFLHFLWQGALAGLLLALGLRRLRAAPAEARYGLAVGALVAVALLPLTTAWLLLPSVPAAASGASATTHPASGLEILPWSRRLLPWLVLGWGLGASLLLLRLACGWRLVRRILREETRPAPPALQALLDRLREGMGLRRPVRLLVGLRSWGPLTHGWLRPVVVVPASCLTGLAPDHLEAILAHELAHVRRRDFLVNLLQSVLEALLFFHPAVWWISHRIRVERENCCDDAAVRSCGDALTYARALASLEEARGIPALGLPARGGTLMNRIRRLLDGGPPTAGRIPWPISAFLALAVAAAAPLAATAQEPEPGQCPHCGAELRLRREAPHVQDVQPKETQPAPKEGRRRYRYRILVPGQEGERSVEYEAEVEHEGERGGLLSLELETDGEGRLRLRPLVPASPAPPRHQAPVPPAPAEVPGTARPVPPTPPAPPVPQAGPERHGVPGHCEGRAFRILEDATGTWLLERDGLGGGDPRRNEAQDHADGERVLRLLREAEARQHRVAELRERLHAAPGRLEELRRRAEELRARLQEDLHRDGLPELRERIQHFQLGPVPPAEPESGPDPSCSGQVPGLGSTEPSLQGQRPQPGLRREKDGVWKLEIAPPGKEVEIRILIRMAGAGHRGGRPD